MSDFIHITIGLIAYAGRQGDRLYVVTNSPRDEHGRALCITRWANMSDAWEASYEFVSEDWSGIDHEIASEVTGHTYLIKQMIAEY